LTIYNVQEIKNVSEFVIQNLVNDNDIIICYNSQFLFDDGDIEHVSLIQEIETENDKLTIVDPAIGVPKVRKTKLSRLIRVLKSHEASMLIGFWIVSRTK